MNAKKDTYHQNYIFLQFIKKINTLVLGGMGTVA
jgi:hypothetical protein